MHGFGEHGVITLDGFVVGEGGVAPHRADLQPAAVVALDIVQIEPIDVHQSLGLHHIQLDQVDQGRAAGQISRGLAGVRLHRAVGVVGAFVIKLLHRKSPSPGRAVGSCVGARLLNGRQNVLVSAAAADVAAHGFGDVRVTTTDILVGEALGSRCQLAGGAVAALIGIVLKKGFLQFAEFGIARQTLDGGDVVGPPAPDRN